MQYILRYLLLLQFVLVYYRIPPALAQTPFHQPPLLAPSYSIVAYNSQTKELAVATLTFFSSSYKTFIWGDTPIGIVTLHSPTTHSFQVWDTQLWQQGHSATDLLHRLIHKDAYKEYYQVICLDTTGQFASFKGTNTSLHTKILTGSNYCILASLPPDSSTIRRMADAFERKANVSLAEQILAPLLAALPANSSAIEKHSASLLVLTHPNDLRALKGRLLDMQVNNKPNALHELDVQMRRQLSYLYFKSGEDAAKQGNLQKAIETYKKAAELFPDDLETQYWYGIMLADHNLIEEACIVLAEVFRKNSKWKERTARLPADGLLHISKKDFERIMSLP